MQNKKVKIIYFSLRDSRAREIELTSSKFYSLLSATLTLLFLLVSGSLALFTSFYQNLEISSLSKENLHLKNDLHKMGIRLTHFESRVSELESYDDDLRVIADLPKIDSDTRNVGVGGYVDVDYNDPLSKSDASSQVYGYKNALDEMERRIELTMSSRFEIKNKLEQNKTVMKHTPSIRPLIGGQIRDKFGLRHHPIIQRTIHHQGIDIAAERGTEVFATAAGVVEKVVTRYQKNKGYGKQVIIDHGFDIKTRYGHLSKILVREGQRIDRWNPVGLVGDTGLATGPHLHYEVIQDGKRKDPLSFILN